MKKKILSIFLSIALILTAIPFTSIGAFAFEEDECSTYGHSYVEINIVDPTCEEDGYIEYTCGVCGGDSYQEPIPSTGHDYMSVVISNPTCTDEGTEEYFCPLCFDIYYETTPALGGEHVIEDYSYNVEDCVLGGTITWHCSVCDYYHYEEIKCDHHEYELVEYRDTTCGQTGYQKYQCTNYNCTNWYSFSFDATGHTFGEWETIQWSTCEQEGINQRTCEICGETEEEIIPKKIDHAFEWIESVAATCTTDGYDIIKCSICGFTDTLEYTATGHTDSDKDELCDDCGEMVSATSGKCGDSLTWKFDESSGELSIYGSGDMYEYTADNRPWRYFADDVTTISVGVSVTTICDYAFYDFKAVTSATIYNDGVTTIGDYAFYNCESLSSITISNTVTSIGDSAFEGCNSLADVYYEDIEDNWNAITIGNNNQPLLNATIHCKILNSGTCGDNLTWVFDERISTLTISGTGAMCNYEKDNRPWEDYKDIIKKLVINDGVTTIGDYAFYRCYIAIKPILPDSVITIGNYAFYGCDFSFITIGNSVKTIGDNAFNGCNYLLSITLPETITTIGDCAFQYCSSLGNVYYNGFMKDWENVTIGDNNTALLKAAMHYKETDSGVCGDNLTWVYDEPTSTLTISGTGAMYDYSYSNRPWENYIENIKTVVMSDGITTIGTYAFYNCENLPSVTIPNSVTKIGNYAFKYCVNITSITIPSSVTSIGKEVFTDCTNLTEITVDDNNEYYSSDEYGVLYNKDKTTLIQYPIGNTRTIYTLPFSVTTILYKAFYGCDAITTVRYQGSGTDWFNIEKGDFNDCVIDAEKYYNYVTSGVCGDNITWVFDEFTGILTISGEGAMYEYTSQTKQPWYVCRTFTEEIVINEGITSIGDYAFSDIYSITSITIPEGVTLIDRYAFANCHNLVNITLPDSLTVIGSGAFDDCKNLASITLPDSLTEIGSNAFTGCNSLVNITIPKGVTTMGTNVFYLCDSLTSITVDSDNQYFSNDEYGVLFSKDKTVLIRHPEAITNTSYVIPDGVTVISDTAFCDCENLTNVFIPNSVKRVKLSAFENCSNLTDAYYIGTETEWKRITNYGNNDSLFKNATIHYNCIPPFTGIKDDYFYKNDVKQKAYQLVEFEGDFYYIADRHQIVKNKTVYITTERTNGLTFADGTPILAGNYEFDENGKMVIYNGLVGDYVYKNSVKLKAYQLVEVDGNFYYIADRHQIVKNKTVYITAERTNGLIFADGTPIPAGNYEFDENGKMVIYNGLVGDYVYKNSVKLKAYQLVEVDGDFYYIADRHQIVKNKTVYITAERANGLTFADGTPIPAGNYEFDENGKMVILDGIVGNNIYKNGVKLKAYQLAEVDGSFYFIGDRHEIVKSQKFYLNEERINGLTFADGTPIPTGTYSFDENGKMIISN